MFSPHKRKRSPASKRVYLLLLALALGLGLATLWATGMLAAPAPVSASSAQTGPPTPAPNLIASNKSASRHLLAPGKLLTYTVRLRNVGTAQAVAQVTDRLPAQVNYVLGSATSGAAYDGKRTLTWEDITVPVRSDVSLSFAVTTTEVTTRTVVTNTAVIRAAAGSFERSVWVLLVPESVGPGPILAGSRKLASRHVIGPDELLTYTIRLRNTGAASATARVMDPLPPEVEYISGSATSGAVYDEVARTLSWENITVPVAGDEPLSFAVTTTEVATPTVVTNTAVISAADGSFERSTWVLLKSVGPGPILVPSHKFASRHLLAPEELLTYTVRLRNVGTAQAVAQVTDRLPAQVSYISGSAASGAVYDPDGETLSWEDITVPVRSDVSLSFAVTTTEVTTPTLVINTAVISAGDASFERRALVLLAPERPRRRPKLAGSRKSASQHVLPPDDVLTYTIRLHNSGTAQAVAQVTDRLPAQVSYISGSAASGAVYDPDGETLSWDGITVPVRSDVSLSFAVTTTGVVTPTVVTNTVVITADGEALERRAKVLLMPERPERDTVPPVVHSLTIDEQDALSSPTVTLHISATDDVGVGRMFLREWRWMATPWPHWRVVQSSGWIPYQANHPWTLGPESGMHFVGVWVADGARNRSQLDMRALDFASLVQPGATVTIPPFGVVPYFVYYDAGVDVTAVLTPTAGDADLYAWYTGDLTQPIYTATEVITFTTQSAGMYLFVVRGQPGATYDLSIEPGGGPRPPTDGMPEPSVAESGRGTRVRISERDQTDSDQAEDLIAVLDQSGLDPLETAQAPTGPLTHMYLPIVVR